MGRTKNCQGCGQAALFTLPSPYSLLAGYALNDISHLILAETFLTQKVKLANIWQ